MPERIARNSTQAARVFQEMRNVLITLLLTALVALFAYSVWVSPDMVAPSSQNGDRPHMATSSGE
jgi:hypothetical protein